MLVSPLLHPDVVINVATLLKNGDSEDKILDELRDSSIVEKVHILRFLFNKPEFSEMEIIRLLHVWHTIISPTHILDTEQNRKALYEIGQWWDTFGPSKGMTRPAYDRLESLLDTLGTTSEGKDYFKWVALSPIDMKQKGVMWDEDRRGAIVSLGKYAYNRETETFLVHQLDDVHIIQIEAIKILIAMKSRLLAKLAPWYIQNDNLLKSVLQEYF